jgi:hypothetical protein
MRRGLAIQIATANTTNHGAASEAAASNAQLTPTSATAVDEVGFSTAGYLLLAPRHPALGPWSRSGLLDARSPAGAHGSFRQRVRFSYGRGVAVTAVLPTGIDVGHCPVSRAVAGRLVRRVPQHDESSTGYRYACCSLALWAGPTVSST